MYGFTLNGDGRMVKIAIYLLHSSVAVSDLQQPCHLISLSGTPAPATAVAPPAQRLCIPNNVGSHPNWPILANNSSCKAGVANPTRLMELLLLLCMHSTPKRLHRELCHVKILTSHHCCWASRSVLAITVLHPPPCTDLSYLTLY